MLAYLMFLKTVFVSEYAGGNSGGEGDPGWTIPSTWRKSEGDAGGPYEKILPRVYPGYITNWCFQQWPLRCEHLSTCPALLPGILESSLLWKAKTQKLSLKCLNQFLDMMAVAFKRHWEIKYKKISQCMIRPRSLNAQYFGNLALKINLKVRSSKGDVRHLFTFTLA